MPSYAFSLLYGACALLISLPAIAQTKPAAKEDAMHANAAVPASGYESAFRSYMPYREQPLAGWREVNDEVGRVGGHVGMFGGTHGGHPGARPNVGAPAGAPAARAQEGAAQPPARSAPASAKQHKGHE